MCGIIGIVGDRATQYEKNARNMMERIAHRGPDGDGLKIFDNCALGHRRLSIVDLAGGAQPMFNQNGDVGLVFNGEIYGYKEIKERLIKEHGYQFKTSSDTEVLLALYDIHGEQFVKHLPGMFAYGLWDDKTQTFVAGRDRFGEKPFFYAIGKNKELIFASEIKAIIASGLIRPEISRESVAHYLNKIYVHPTKTIYKNIHSLPPAHMLVYKNSTLNVTRYWNQPKTSANGSLSLDEALPEFKRLLNDAVAKQLVADVPVGAFLSGGVDSTTVVSIASKLSPHIKTFSFGYRGTKNELSFARMAAERYGTDHYELHDKDFNIAELVVKMSDIYDEPFADSSNISTYLISKLTREHTTVVLSGDGGDELLGGYQGWNRPIMAMSDPKIKNFPGKAHLMRLIARVAIRNNWQKKVALINQARGLYYRDNFEKAVDAHRMSNVFFKESELRELGLLTKNNPQSILVFPPPSWEPSNTVDDALRDDLENYMPGDILVKTDRASMANSLELRAPFLDVPFAEFAISLPHRLKITDTEDKMILRRAFEQEWPEAIRTRSKQGFGAPIHIWLNGPEMDEVLNKYLNDPKKKIFSFISFEKSRAYVAKKDYKTWILLTLSIWMETHDFDF